MYMNKNKFMKYRLCYLLIYLIRIIESTYNLKDYGLWICTDVSFYFLLQYHALHAFTFSLNRWIFLPHIIIYYYDCCSMSAKFYRMDPGP